MNIAYVTHTRFPTEKAHGHQIARVCSAMAHLKHSVTLVAPNIFTRIRQTPERYYHLNSAFSVEKLPIFDALASPLVPERFAFLLTMHSYRRALKRYFAEQQFDVLYARSPSVVPALLETGMPVVLELHTLPRRNQQSFVKQCNACTKVVCLTTPMRDELVSWGVEKSRVVVEGDAVDPERFANVPTLKKAKHHYSLPNDKVVVGYVGSYVTMTKLEKGVPFIIDALLALKKKMIPVHGFFVGGPEQWATKYRTLALQKGLLDSDITFHGSVQSKLVPDAIAACDICVYPAPDTKKPFFQRDTSPLKIFEYLSVGRPVVCADIPPLRDIVSKESVKMVHPGSVSSLVGGIRDVIENSDAAKKRSAKGLEIVKYHTWEKRMKRILDAVR